jgi:hypothetical protein
VPAADEVLVELVRGCVGDRGQESRQLAAERAQE